MAATVRASQRGLEKIDQARRSKGWTKTEQAWYQLAFTSEATLKRFQAGNPVKQETFAAICEAVGIEDWQTIADLSIPSEQTISTLPPLPGIYSAATWVERIELTETLLPVLQSDRRIIVLTGMTGIGKTALAERLTLPLQDGKTLRRLNLDDGGITADFATSGAALLRTLGEEPTLEDQKDAKNLLNHILDRLRTRPHRIQIDSLERLLEGDERQGWSEFCDSLWLDLLQRVLAGNECQSQVILTTQDVPGKLEAIGSRYPQRWHCEPIRGLSEVEQLQLFQKRGIVAAFNATVEAQHNNVTGQHLNVTVDNANAEGQHRIAGANNATGANSAVSLLKRIGKLYEGHPLVLGVIAEDIKTCGGDVQRYWQQCRFAELEANCPAKFSRRKLQLQVNQRVRESLDRLPDDAKQLLCRSAVYRRPVPESFWLTLLPERTETQQQAALNLLKARTFAEEDWEPGVWLGSDGEIPLRQHNLIRSVAYEMLRQDSATWETAERQAAEQWLNSYEPAPDVANLKKVQGYLEAFNHYCNVEAWREAEKLFTSSFNSSRLPLCQQLNIWGYYWEEIQICKRLLGQSTNEMEMIAYHEMSIACSELSNYSEAIELCNKNLSIARSKKDRLKEAGILITLGIAYWYQHKYPEAIKHIEQALTIARKLDDRVLEGRGLLNLGNIYSDQGEPHQAIGFYKNYLNLILIGKIDDQQGEGIARLNLGARQAELEKWVEARANLDIALEIFEEKFDDPVNKARVLQNLAMLLQDIGEINQAKKYCDRALELAIELGIPLEQECRSLQSELYKEVNHDESRKD